MALRPVRAQGIYSGLQILCFITHTHTHTHTHAHTHMHIHTYTNAHLPPPPPSNPPHIYTCRHAHDWKQRFTPTARDVRSQGGCLLTTGPTDWCSCVLIPRTPPPGSWPTWRPCTGGWKGRPFVPWTVCVWPWPTPPGRSRTPPSSAWPTSCTRRVTWTTPLWSLLPPWTSPTSCPSRTLPSPTSTLPRLVQSGVAGEGASGDL